MKLKDNSILDKDVNKDWRNQKFDKQQKYWEKNLKKLENQIALDFIVWSNTRLI